MHPSQMDAATKAIELERLNLNLENALIERNQFVQMCGYKSAEDCRNDLMIKAGMDAIEAKRCARGNEVAP